MEDDLENNFRPVQLSFDENSEKWKSAIDTFSELSSCLIESASKVQEMSSFWLKPITMVYPFPFSPNTNISTIKAWLDENFPVQGGECFNYITGQQLYIFSPEYFTINRKITGNKGVGKQSVVFKYTCFCIGRAEYSNQISKTVDCGEVNLELNVPDQYINKFVGVKFEVLPNLQWSTGEVIYE